MCGGISSIKTGVLAHTPSTNYLSVIRQDAPPPRASIYLHAEGGKGLDSTESEAPSSF